jgi:hypothetical protein
MKNIMIILVFFPCFAHAQSLGRLFFTPQERATMDSLRQHPGQTALRGIDSGEGGATGSVELKGGGKTVWIDGTPRHLAPGRKK